MTSEQINEIVNSNNSLIANIQETNKHLIEVIKLLKKLTDDTIKT